MADGREISVGDSVRIPGAIKDERGMLLHFGKVRAIMSPYCRVIINTGRKIVFWDGRINEVELMERR